MNITQVAEKTGLSAKTIRFYEEKSLITPPTRSENGYCYYQPAHLDELTLLRQARAVGFTLKDCRQLIELFHNPHHHSADIKTATLNKISEIEKKLPHLMGSEITYVHWLHLVQEITMHNARLLIIWLVIMLIRPNWFDG